MGQAPAEARTSLRGYAHCLGLAFQIADDLLDHDGDEARVGKRLRKDDDQGKVTFVTMLGVERARRQARAARRPGHRASAGLRRGSRTARGDRPLRDQPGPLSSSPASTPIRIASAELRTPSRASRLARCIFTVFSSMPRKPAICLLR